MKIKLKCVFIFLLLLNFACKKETSSIVIYHKSHEEKRQNVPFSDAVQVGNTYFLTGQIGKNHKTGKLVDYSIELQTKQAILNIEDVLKQHNLTLDNVVKCTVILANINDFSKMNNIYRKYFTNNLPARTTFAASLVADAKIEIEVVAVKQ
jgi:2-iminobutanoate/2-iminopropanoate deaminase